MSIPTATPTSSSTVVGETGGVVKRFAFSFLSALSGAVARTFESKLADTVSVKDFGATGDGTTDDTAAIQSAITATPAGSTIYFPSGLYVVSSALSGIKHGHRFVGAGVPEDNIASPYLPSAGTSSFIKFTAASGWLFPISLLHWVAIENMGLTAPSTTGGLIHLAGTQFCSVKNINARGVTSGTVLKLSDNTAGCYFNTVDNVLMKSGMSKGIHLATDVNGFVNNNLFRNVEISGASVGVGVQIDCGNTNVFDTASIEPTSTTAHLKVTGGVAVFRNARIEGIAGTEGRVYISGGSVKFVEDGPVVATTGIRDVRGTASLTRVPNTSTLIPDPEFSYDGSLPYGFTLAAGTLSTSELVTTDRPAWAYFGRSFHAVSSATEVDVSCINSADVATYRGRNVYIRGWAKAVSGSAGFVIRSFSPTTGNTSSTCTSFTTGEWEFFQVGITIPSDATNIQAILRMNGNGSEAYFFMPYIGEPNDYQGDRLAVSAGGGTVPGLLNFLQGIKVNGNRHTSASASPSSGTWARGDVVWNSAPSAGGAPGWMCVTAGTPGTWKAMANLAA